MRRRATSLTAAAALGLRRLLALFAPLLVALAAGHIAYGLPGTARYEIAMVVGHPYATSDAAAVIYGHDPGFD